MRWPRRVQSRVCFSRRWDASRISPRARPSRKTPSRPAASRRSVRWIPAFAGGTDVDELIRAFKASGTSLACLVGTDTDYAAEAVSIAAALTKAGATTLLMAGKPGDLEAPLAESGVSGYVAFGMDLVAFLDRLLTSLEQKS